MKNSVIAIRETETRSRFYVVLDTDIATGKAYVYNPDTGFTTVTPYKDKDAFKTRYIRENPYPWMTAFNAAAVTIPANWAE